MQNYFISCDWGTSSFRLRVAEAGSCRVWNEISSNQGIAATYQAYRKEVTGNRLSQQDRPFFYIRYLQEQLQVLEKKTNFQLQGLPVIISGMASSSIGMLELPYATLPFSLDGRHTLTHIIPSQADFPHKVLLISGLRSAEDVMRGEETQLIGLAASLKITQAVCLFPGTHSKHIYVRDGSITGFRTYMTGEVFNTVAKHTILQASLDDAVVEDTPQMMAAFRQGVQAAVKLENILHALFTVRTSDLFNKRSRQENYFYLSGLLIGNELQDLAKEPQTPVYLCSSSHLLKFYQAAAEVLEYTGRMHVVSGEIIDHTAIIGQWKIWQQTQQVQ